ncbi:MAG: SARP family transcriptional regulator, partial [Chloroflexi bacterium]|nr:SARP family transcriptional regulator [Chloroflexota bacterium]
LLGTFQVTLDGKRVTQFQVDAARLLLAYLAMDPQVSFRREILAGLLWPEKPELSASKNFRTTLNRLRNAIGDKTAVPPYLTITRKNIQFNRASNHWLDVTQFSTLIEKTRQHHHPHLITCPSCIKNLTKAATLYQGEFMHGFSSNSNMLDTWLAETREHLHPQIMMTLFQLAHHHEKQTCDYEQVQFYARRQLKLEPWQEASHRQMMRALAFSGQRNAALLRYDMCRQILADELGIQPTARTTRLYRKIEAGAYSNHKANLYDGITIPQNQHN